MTCDLKFEHSTTMVSRLTSSRVFFLRCFLVCTVLAFSNGHGQNIFLRIDPTTGQYVVDSADGGVAKENDVLASVNEQKLTGFGLNRIFQAGGGEFILPLVREDGLLLKFAKLRQFG